jgi:hypothetical protein
MSGSTAANRSFWRNRLEVARLYCGIFSGVACCCCDLFHSRYDSAHPWTHPRGSAGIRSTKFTMDIGMKRLTFWRREGRRSMRLYPEPFANCSSASRAATQSTSSMKRECIATTMRTWTATQKDCGRECGSRVGTSSVMWIDGQCRCAHAPLAFCDLRIGTGKAVVEGKGR